MKLSTLIILSIVVLSVSVALDIFGFQGIDKHWFQRSGSILVLFGALFESKYILRTSSTTGNVIEGGLKIPGRQL